MRVKLFTHTDLDGVGCAILGKMAFGENIDITYCNYDNINEKVKEFLIGDERSNYNLVYITDISVDEIVANIIQDINSTKCFPYTQLLDHHPTAEFLNKYDWATVTIEVDGEKTSGTKMFFGKLVKSGYLFTHKSTYDFTEIVRKYDTWLWKTKYNDETPKLWNDLFYILGRDKFIDRMTVKIYKDMVCFDDADRLLLELEQDKIKRYIDKKNKELVTMTLKDYAVGVVCAEQFISQLGNELATLNPQLDFIVIASLPNTISYRGIKKDIDLGKFAQLFGGGGHQQSAGSQISKEKSEIVLRMLLL